MDLNELNGKVNQLEKDVRELIASLSGLRIDIQMAVQRKERIRPGTGCKIYYDSNGLIMKSEDLEAGDIPLLPIEKIDGLLERLQKKSSESKEKHEEPKKIKAGSGIKINYDEYGRVTSSSESLLPTDIPELTMDKIAGLEDTIKTIREELNGILNQRKEKYRIAPGTAVKVSYGEDGRIISGSELTMDDIPRSLISKINLIESRIPSLASQEVVNTALSRLNKKLDANVPIYGGTFTKVHVDENGLVTQGDRITVEDIGTITINNIADLPSILKNKANQSDMIQVLNTVNQLASSDQSSEIVRLKNMVESKANDYTVKSIQAQVGNLTSSIDNLLNRIPDRDIMDLVNTVLQSNEDIKRRLITFENEINEKIDKLKK